jgi:hypothetical protein
VQAAFGLVEPGTVGHRATFGEVLNERLHDLPHWHGQRYFIQADSARPLADWLGRKREGAIGWAAEWPSTRTSRSSECRRRS